MDVRLQVTRKRVGLLVAAISLAGVAGVAYATIPDGNGLFTACRHNLTGAVRLIDPSIGGRSLLGRCTPQETQVSWNEQGQPGATGATGPQGPAGPAGPHGPAGPSVRAYGHVTNRAPYINIEGLRSKNIVKVEQPAPGFWCITADSSIDPATAVLVATPDEQSSINARVYHLPSGTFQSQPCPEEEFVVTTYEASVVTVNGVPEYRETRKTEGFFFVIP